MESGQSELKVNFIALNALITEQEINQLFNKSTQEVRKLKVE